MTQRDPVPVPWIEAENTLACAGPEVAVPSDQQRIHLGMRKPLILAIIRKLVAVELRQTLSCAKPQITALVSGNCIDGVPRQAIGGAIDPYGQLFGLREQRHSQTEERSLAAEKFAS